MNSPQNCLAYTNLFHVWLFYHRSNSIITLVTTIQIELHSNNPRQLSTTSDTTKPGPVFYNNYQQPITFLNLVLHYQPGVGGKSFPQLVLLTNHYSYHKPEIVSFDVIDTQTHELSRVSRVAVRVLGVVEVITSVDFHDVVFTNSERAVAQVIKINVR